MCSANRASPTAATAGPARLGEDEPARARASGSCLALLTRRMAALTRGGTPASRREVAGLESGARRAAAFRIASNGVALTSPPPIEYQCLIVEDSPMMRQLLVFALSRMKQIKVTEADDGVDGLKKLATGKFDIILTDINMPIMDGLKLVKRVRTDPIHKDVPIVIITTESAEEDRQRALALGANAYITKPIQAPQVIAKVRELLGIEASPTSGSMPVSG